MENIFFSTSGGSLLDGGKIDLIRALPPATQFVKGDPAAKGQRRPGPRSVAPGLFREGRHHRVLRGGDIGEAQKSLAHGGVEALLQQGQDFVPDAVALREIQGIAFILAPALAAGAKVGDDFLAGHIDQWPDERHAAVPGPGGDPRQASHTGAADDAQQNGLRLVVGGVARGHESDPFAPGCFQQEVPPNPARGHFERFPARLRLGGDIEFPEEKRDIERPGKGGDPAGVGIGGFSADAVVHVGQGDIAAELAEHQGQGGGIGAAAGGDQHARPAKGREAFGQGFPDRRDHRSFRPGERGDRARPCRDAGPRAGGRNRPPAGRFRGGPRRGAAGRRRSR